MSCARLLCRHLGQARWCSDSGAPPPSTPRATKSWRQVALERSNRTATLQDINQTTIQQATSASPSPPPSATLDPHLSNETVAFHLGQMVAHCLSQPSFRSQYQLLHNPGWSTLASANPKWAEFVNTTHTTATHPRIVGIDVEMIIRRSTGEKIPIKGALVEAVLSRGKFEMRTSQWLIDPMVPLNQSDFDWKTETHGVTHDFFANNRHTAATLDEVQHEILSCIAPPATCLVGHMLKEDLTALRICGSSLSEKVIDTAFLFGTRDDGGAFGLKDILSREKYSALGCDFRKTSVHDPLEDALACVQVMKAEVRLLANGGSLPALKLPTRSATQGVFLIQRCDIKLLIGPGGANMKRVRSDTGAIVIVSTMVMPTPHHCVVTVRSASQKMHEQSMKMVADLVPGRLLEMK